MKPFLAALLTLTSVAACSPSAPPLYAGRVIRTTAPANISEVNLGVPLDVRFLPIQGPDGKTLYPDAGRVKATIINHMAHEVSAVETEEGLAASIQGWGILEASAGMSNEYRYASYRAVQLSHVAEIDDTTPMREPPPGAVYYPWRIYYGHSYEVVFTGRYRDFHAGVRAQLHVVSGGADAFANTHRLEMKAIGRGMEPVSGRAIFARAPYEIEGGYRASGPPVPIVVDYRQIPGTFGLGGQYGWPTPLRITVTFRTLRVIRDGTWGKTPWDLRASCSVNGVEIPLADPAVWAGNTTDGASYPINWRTNLDAFDGDQVECSTTGRYSGPIAGGHNIPMGRMKRPVLVGQQPVSSTVIAAGDQSASYEIGVEVSVAR